MTRVVLTGGVVVDAVLGHEPFRGDVALEADRIVAVGGPLDGDVAVDCSGCAISPGFIDCHVHLSISSTDYTDALDRPFGLQYFETARNMAGTLHAGVTTVRDAGGVDLGTKVAQQTGLIEGPDTQISITMISQTGGHNDDWYACGCTAPFLFVPHPGRPTSIADGEDEVRRKVRELVRAGADVIKIATSGGVLSPRDSVRHGHFSQAEIDVIVQEASAAGRFVMSHADATAGILTAIRAGVRSIEHGAFLDDECIDLMLANGTWLVPTLAATRAVERAARSGNGMSREARDKALSVAAAHFDSVARAVARGVRVALGSDAGVVAHGSNLDELELLTQAGLRPIDALAAATRSAAELLGVADDRGTLEVGKRADIVVYTGEPLDVVGISGRLAAVVQNGRLAWRRPGFAGRGW